MYLIKISPFYDDMNENAAKIHSVANQLRYASKVLQTIQSPESIEGDTLLKNIIEVLNSWTGNTYVGHPKEKVLKKAFQVFFDGLFEFVLSCKDCRSITNHKMFEEALYHGTVYRYLGHGTCHNTDISAPVEPTEDKTWVSWSKAPENAYIESKLYGTLTRLTCVIPEDRYGIDLEFFGVVRGNEEEVVFPTCLDLITKMEFIER